MYYSYKTKANEFPKPKLAFLVFPDSGEKCSTTGGSAPNAVSPRYETTFEKLELLKNAVTKELGDEKYGTVRLFVQATKEEIKDGPTEIVLISTNDELFPANPYSIFHTPKLFVICPF